MCVCVAGWVEAGGGKLPQRTAHPSTTRHSVTGQKVPRNTLSGPLMSQPGARVAGRWGRQGGRQAGLARAPVALMKGSASHAMVSSLLTPMGYSTMKPLYLWHTPLHGVRARARERDAARARVCVCVRVSSPKEARGCVRATAAASNPVQAGRQAGQHTTHARAHTHTHTHTHTVTLPATHRAHVAK
jgi:hypothetical protein